MHPLDGPRLKLWRARIQIKALDRTIQWFLVAHPYRPMRSDINPDTGRYELRVAEGPDALPPAWALQVGEITHNLRSALDSLVCQLAIQTDKRRTWRFCAKRKTAFPVHLRGPRAKGGNHFTKSTINYLRDRHVACIESLQPYKTGNGRRASPLWLLHEMNNSDKHRLIPVLAQRSGWITMTPLSSRIENIQLIAGAPLHPGAKIGEVGEPLTQRQVEMYVGIAPKVVFGKGCDAVESLFVIPTLVRTANQAYRIVESFASEFA